jgi:mannose/fructose/N-acetylgalactosamine-specific phosphotransferase system component IIC
MTTCIIIGSIFSLLAVGCCVFKHKKEKAKRTSSADAKFFAIKQKREMKEQHLMNCYVPAGRGNYGSISITNPGLCCTVVPI